MKHLYDNAIAGTSAVGHLMAIIITGFIGIVVEYVIQKSNPSFTGLSQDATNTIQFLEVALVYVFMIYLIAIIISHYINEKSMSNQGV
jgi:uncharacterized BrkB/YihY/UPF0761 family membrane protein